MRKYYIDYLDKSGDLTHIWISAYDPQEAINEARSEYWDIEEIIQVYEA